MSGTFEELNQMLKREDVRDIFARTLPRGVNVDAWLSGALVAVRTTRDVQHATSKSTMGALITAASLGLRLEGVLGLAYLTAFKVMDRSGDTWQVKEYQTQLQIGYLGLIQMALRNSLVQDCEARIVHQQDSLSFQFGSEQRLEHTWDHMRPRGPMVAVYAALRYTNGYYSFSDPYPMEDIETVRERALRDKGIRCERTEEGIVYYKTYRGQARPMKAHEAEHTPWIAHPKPMAMKTAIRWAAKYWNLGESFDRAASLVALDDNGLSQGLSDVAQQYLDDARRAQRTAVIGAGRTDRNTEPTAPDLLRPYAGKQGADLKARMLAEATNGGQPDTPPEQPADVTSPNGASDITREEAEEIRRRELAEARAFEQRQQTSDDEDR